MVQKDADLATDYNNGTLYLTNDKAEFEIIEVIQVNQPAALPELFLVELVPGGSTVGLVYRMRGYDETLASIVFWNSSKADAAGEDYIGPGPLTSIIVRSVSGD